jgi:Xaa-Pro aminopeptidase
MNTCFSSIIGRLADVRSVLEELGIAALLIPSADPHLSEYLPERWQGRQWLSGFTGSMGMLVITVGFAGIWTDSRYWAQAEQQLHGTGINLMKIEPGSPAHGEWLAENVQASGVVVVDGNVLGLAASRQLKSALAVRNITLRTNLDILDQVWRDRPELPVGSIFEHLPPYTVVSRGEKLAMIRAEMSRVAANWHFVSTLDDIAWILNLRGSDVPYNPIFVSHVLIGVHSATLFVTAGKIDRALGSRLAQDGITIEPYEHAVSALAAIPAGAAVLIDPSRVAVGLIENVRPGIELIERVNPSTLEKSRKTLGEIEHIRHTMVQDGAALCEFFDWFERARTTGERITELTVDDKITAARARRPGFVSRSFATIAGFNGNGALPHYRATAESHAVIEGNGLLLIDSGGQYLGGTTDITRVVAVGQVSNEQRRDFTLVLKGMIQLTLAQFPRGVRSPRLDAIARAPIWAAGIDYGHGTGHGVGYFLNVHEGPHSISAQGTTAAHLAMEPGMITSNEPGIYRSGRWGVRLENLTVTQSVGTGEFGEFLAFDTLTLCPIDTRCVEVDILDQRERQWLNDYHLAVRNSLLDLVQDSARQWLLSATEAV